MTDLTVLRDEIDHIDEQLVHLFEERMNVVQQVAEYKKEHHIAVQDTNRERQVIDQCTALLKNREYAPALEEWLKLTMSLSRNSEHKKIDK